MQQQCVRGLLLLRTRHDGHLFGLVGQVSAASLAMTRSTKPKARRTPGTSLVPRFTRPGSGGASRRTGRSDLVRVLVVEGSGHAEGVELGERRGCLGAAAVGGACCLPVRVADVREVADGRGE